MAEYHDLPIALDARLSLDMRFYHQKFGNEPPLFEMTAKGNWQARLNFEKTRLASGRDVDGYSGKGTFNFTSATSKDLGASGQDDCLITYAEVPINGTLAAHVTGAYYTERGHKLRFWHRDT